MLILLNMFFCRSMQPTIKFPSLSLNKCHSISHSSLLRTWLCNLVSPYHTKRLCFCTVMDKGCNTFGNSLWQNLVHSPAEQCDKLQFCSCMLVSGYNTFYLNLFQIRKDHRKIHSSYSDNHWGFHRRMQHTYDSYDICICNPTNCLCHFYTRYVDWIINWRSQLRLGIGRDMKRVHTWHYGHQD